MTITYAFQFGYTQSLSFNHYTTKDGLVQMQIEDLLVDQNKNIWIGTRGGASKFNGRTFDNFENIQNKPNYVLGIEEQADGKIIFLSPDALHVFDGQKFQEYTFPEGNEFIPDSYFEKDWEGRIICKSKFGENIFYFSNDTITEFLDEHPALKSFSISEIIAVNDEKKFYFIDQHEYLYEYNHGEIKEIFHTKNRLRDLCYLKILNQEVKPIFTFKEMLNSSEYICYTIDDGQVKELHSFNNTKVEIKNKCPETYLLFNSIDLLLVHENSMEMQVLLSDIPGSFNHLGGIEFLDQKVMLSTDKGLIVIPKEKFISYSEKELPNIWSIGQRKDGVMFFGGYGTGIFYEEEGSIKTFSNFNNEFYCGDRQLKNTYKSIYMGATSDWNKDLLFPFGNGLIKIEDSQAHLLDHIESCKGTLAYLMVYTDLIQKKILVGTCQGVRILDENGNLIRTIKEGLFEHRCMLTITKDRNGNYWFGATGGIAKYNFDNNEIVNYTKDNGNLDFDAVICSYKDIHNNLWIGTKSGIAVYNESSDAFNSVENFSNLSVSSMIEGENGQMFLTTNKGLIMLDLNKYYRDKTVVYKLFGESTGFMAQDLGQNGLFKDQDGLIWICSATHVTRFDPVNLSYDTNIYKPYITRVNGGNLAFNSIILKIEEEVNDVTFEFEVRGLDQASQLLFSQRLLGQNNKWSDWNSYTNTTYNNLGGGKYTFQVRAKDKLQTNDPEIYAAQKIEIDIPLLKEPGFAYFLGFGLLALVFVSFFYASNYRLEKENMELLSKLNKTLIFEKEELITVNEKLKKDILKIKLKKDASVGSIDIKSNKTQISIPLSEILYISAEGNGSRYILQNGKSHWDDKKLKYWENQLPMDRFVRIHRSTIVQKEFITSINYDNLELFEGTSLNIGRTYKSNLK